MSGRIYTGVFDALLVGETLRARVSYEPCDPSGRPLVFVHVERPDSDGRPGVRRVFAASCGTGLRIARRELRRAERAEARRARTPV